MRRIRLRGCDNLTRFSITRGTCDVCGKKRVLCVVYDRHPFTPDDPEIRKALAAERVYRMLTWIDLLAHTILGKAFRNSGRGRLGLQCGCYAKFQRQIVHVASSVERKPGYKRPKNCATDDILREAAAAGYDGAI